MVMTVMMLTVCCLLSQPSGGRGRGRGPNRTKTNYNQDDSNTSNEEEYNRMISISSTMMKRVSRHEMYCGEECIDVMQLGVVCIIYPNPPGPGGEGGERHPSPGKRRPKEQQGTIIYRREHTSIEHE